MDEGRHFRNKHSHGQHTTFLSAVHLVVHGLANQLYCKQRVFISWTRNSAESRHYDLLIVFLSHKTLSKLTLPRNNAIEVLAESAQPQ